MPVDSYVTFWGVIIRNPHLILEIMPSLHPRHLTRQRHKVVQNYEEIVNDHFKKTRHVHIAGTEFHIYHTTHDVRENITEPELVIRTILSNLNNKRRLPGSWPISILKAFPEKMHEKLRKILRVWVRQPIDVIAEAWRNTIPLDSPPMRELLDLLEEDRPNDYRSII